MKWIKGKALRTVLELRPLQVGDQVLVRACDKACEADPLGCTSTGHHGMVSWEGFTRQLAFVVEEPNRRRDGTSTGSILVRYKGHRRAVGKPGAPPHRYMDTGALMCEMGIFIERKNIRAWRLAPMKRERKSR